MTEDLSKIIWDYFSAKGLNPFAISGILGNLYIDSGLSSNKLEDAAQTRLKITSEEYTKMVDNDQYKNFVKDVAAYGLAQWKYYKRKESLYNLSLSFISINVILYLSLVYFFLDSSILIL